MKTTTWLLDNGQYPSSLSINKHVVCFQTMIAKLVAYHVKIANTLGLIFNRPPLLISCHPPIFWNANIFWNTYIFEVCKHFCITQSFENCEHFYKKLELFLKMQEKQKIFMGFNLTIQRTKEEKNPKVFFFANTNS